MTAPSIKEALEYIEMADNRLECDCEKCVDVARSYLVEAKAALATFQPDGEKREAIALALAEKWPGDYMQGDDEVEREPNALAYEVADVALSSVGLSSAAICALEESRSLVEWLLEGRELDDMDQIRIGKWSAACQKADDAILASGFVQNEAGIRAIKFAVNEIADPLDKHAFLSLWLHGEWDEIRSNWPEFKSIRSARDGGES